MDEIVSKLFNSTVFRNIIGIGLITNPFDDLSDNPEHWKVAENLAHQYYHTRFSKNDLSFHAIEYIFQQKPSPQSASRFSDGSFPVWYGSYEIETSFHETAFHWQRRFLTDANFLNKNEPIYTTRSVFEVSCKGYLVDFSDRITELSFLVQKNVDKYFESQQLGKHLYEQGFPGLINQSARHAVGKNIVVFNKLLLQSAIHHSDYIYTYKRSDPNKVEIHELRTNNHVQSLEC